MSGRISRETVERVRERADLVELVSARTGQVRMTGGRAMARCPFHDEKTASFSIEPAQKLYHCFGCGVSGDLFRFVMELEACDFPEAVERLAERYGVPIEYEELSAQDAERMDRQKRIEKLLEDTCAYYQRVLADSPDAAVARAYLAERDLDADVVAHWRIGFAPDAWEKVTRGAMGKGYSADDLLTAGIASEGRRGPIDRFRGRLIFPLHDARGRVRGFAGRVLPGGEGAKYVNSPEGPFFHKSRLLYGLHHARAAIAKSGRAVIVEGYTDVIGLHRVGVQEAVASMGTSLTEEQLVELRRLTGVLLLAFDADQAGQDAALRGMRLAEQKGFEVRVVALPPGRDPAEIAAEGREAVEAVLADSRSVLGFQIDLLLRRLGEDGADAVYAGARRLLASAPPTPDRSAQARRVADALRLDPELEARLTRGPRVGQPESGGIPERAKRRLDREQRLERDFLAACIALPGDGLIALDEIGDAITAPEHVAIIGWVRARAGGQDDPIPPGSEGLAAELLAYGRAFDAEDGDAQSPEAARAALRELTLQLRLRGLERRIAAVQARIEAGEASAEEMRDLTATQREAQAAREQLRAGVAGV